MRILTNSGLRFRVFFTDVVTFRLVILRITLFFPVGDKRVEVFVSILFFAYVGIYERDHKQTFWAGALLSVLALFYVVVGELLAQGKELVMATTFSPGQRPDYSALADWNRGQ